jgi:hypothetical protein
MATARLTIGTILGTVNTAASAATGALDTIANTIGMANAYVEKAANEQAGRHKNDAALFTTQLVIEGAEAEAEMHRSVINYCKKSPEHKELFEKAYEKYAKLHGLGVEIEETSTITKLYAAE